MILESKGKEIVRKKLLAELTKKMNPEEKVENDATARMDPRDIGVSFLRVNALKRRVSFMMRLYSVYFV